jgi:hypothetical protein
MNPLIMFGEYTYNYTSDTSNTGGSGWLLFALPLALIFIALGVFVIVGSWRMFQKAGKPGWACIIPFYNTWVLAEIAGKPGWWGLYPLLGVIPVVGAVAVLVVHILICILIARNFGKSDTFGIVWLWLFWFVGFPILGLGAATYKPVDNSIEPAGKSTAQ